MPRAMTDDPNFQAKLQALVDRAEIMDCLQRYARGMDRHDRELARSAYHEDGVDDHVAFVGTVDRFLDWAFTDYHSMQVRHMHYLANHSVELDGDQAHAETYYMFVGTDQNAERPLTLAGGRYVDRFERRNGRWGIAARVCLVEWMSEAPAQLGGMFEFLSSVQTVAQNRTDDSYRRPLTVDRAHT
jgi:hypothetical protein